MFENIISFFKKIGKKEEKGQAQVGNTKDTAKERLHLVLMQDRANVSADFLELMKQEIIDVIKKYIEIDEKEIDVRLTNKENDDGTNGAPALYANIPILNIKNDTKKIEKKDNNIENKEEIEKVAEEATESIENNIQEKREEQNTNTENIIESTVENQENNTEKVDKIIQDVTSIIEEANSENKKENEWI